MKDPCHGRTGQEHPPSYGNQAAPEVLRKLSFYEFRESSTNARPARLPGQEVLQVGKKDVEITHIEPVGTYAIQFTFSDGHSTGIYSWDLLYDYGLHQEEMWRRYLKRVEGAGASREPACGPIEQRPKSK